MRAGHREIEAALSQNFDERPDLDVRNTSVFDDCENVLEVPLGLRDLGIIGFYRWTIYPAALVEGALLLLAFLRLVILAAPTVRFSPLEMISTAERAQEILATAI